MIDGNRKRQAIPPATAAEVFRRDEWLCHWCRRPVILAQAMKFLRHELEQCGWTASPALFHPNWSRDGAPLLDELGATVDHVIAHKRDGAHSAENFVTACAKCNVRKNDRELRTWITRDKRNPVKGKYGEPRTWDGLSSVFVVLAKRYPSMLSVTDREWMTALTTTSDNS